MEYLRTLRKPDVTVFGWDYSDYPEKLNTTVAPIQKATPVVGARG